MKKTVLVHLGCGEINRPYFINVDARALPHVDFVTNDLFTLNMFKELSVDMFYACHVIEHISWRRQTTFFDHIFSKLRSGGKFRVSVPDFDLLQKIYKHCKNDIGSINRSLMGNQDYEYNYHYSVFNVSYLTELFTCSGFKNVHPWNPIGDQFHDFDDWANKTLNGFPVSLNLEGEKF